MQYHSKFLAAINRIYSSLSGMQFSEACEDAPPPRKRQERCCCIIPPMLASKYYSWFGPADRPQQAEWDPLPLHLPCLHHHFSRTKRSPLGAPFTIQIPLQCYWFIHLTYQYRAAREHRKSGFLCWEGRAWTFKGQLRYWVSVHGGWLCIACVFLVSSFFPLLLIEICVHNIFSFLLLLTVRKAPVQVWY